MKLKKVEARKKARQADYDRMSATPGAGEKYKGYRRPGSNKR